MSALDDLASDFSRFHGIRDAGSLPSRVFLRLAARLEAYGGVMAARRMGTLTAPQRAPDRPQPAPRPSRYSATSPYYNNARAAEGAPPATGGVLAGLNASLGSTWFSYRTVPAEGG